MGRKTIRRNVAKQNNIPKKQTPKQTTPVPIQQNKSSVLGNLAQGATMGAGMAVGSEMIHGLFDSKNQVINEQPNNQNKCKIEARQFQECIENNSNNLGNCQVYYDYLQQCNANFKM